jgi:hypothetical protein
MADLCGHHRRWHQDASFEQRSQQLMWLRPLVILDHGVDLDHFTSAVLAMCDPDRSRLTIGHAVPHPEVWAIADDPSGFSVESEAEARGVSLLRRAAETVPAGVPVETVLVPHGHRAARRFVEETQRLASDVIFVTCRCGRPQPPGSPDAT